MDRDIPPIASSRKVKISVVRYEAPRRRKELCPQILERFVGELAIDIGLFMKCCFCGLCGEVVSHRVCCCELLRIADVACRRKLMIVVKALFIQNLEFGSKMIVANPIQRLKVF